MKSHTKIFWTVTICTKLSLAQNLFVLCTIKYMNLLEFIIELKIQYYLALKNENAILYRIKKWYYMFFLIITQKSKLTQMMICL